MSLDLGQLLLDVARDAAAVISEVYATPFDVSYKSPSDPVTLADQRANELICGRLAAVLPGVPIVAEESAPETYARFRDSERVIFVDPLDGTREFILKNGEFVVMIGVLDGERPSAGVIHQPSTGRAWLGLANQGAWEVAPDGVRRALQVSPLTELSRARLVASRSHRSEALERAVERLGVSRSIVLGSAGLKGAAVACAEAELYLAPGYAGKRWDVCATDAIVTAAGGRVSDVTGAPMDYRGPTIDNDRGLVVTNGLLHDAVLARLPPAE